MFVKIGGLASYAPDRLEIYRRAAGYVDRILRGEKASDLPFQQPTKFELVINMNRAANNPEGQARLAAFQQGLQQLGWIDGRNVRIDIRWGEDDADRERKYAAELVALAPDVILASGTLSVAAMQQASRSLPIVFAAVTDPVGAGFVDSLAQPGGNATGF